MYPIIRTRHVRLREFRIRDYHEEGQVHPYWLPGELHVADIKILGKTGFDTNI